GQTQLKDVAEAARSLGHQLVVATVDREEAFDAAFANLAEQGVGGLIVAADPLLSALRTKVITSVARLRTPAMYWGRDMVAAGGLMGYGSDAADAYRQAGAYAARILKGAAPANLPVLQPTKYQLA